jgi:hypothetical protein
MRYLERTIAGLSGVSPPGEPGRFHLGSGPF